MIPTLSRTLLLSLLLATAAMPALGAASAQGSEVTCPIFIPESPAKYCIIVTGAGCVIIHVSTVGEVRTIETCGP